jgi:hypothetical protein
MDATRISDGKYVMLKRLLDEEGPHELQLNRLFSSDPLALDPRNHCARLLDVIGLPSDLPIMVHCQLRPFDDPPFHTYGEFVAFFGQICEVYYFFFGFRSFRLHCSIDQGVQFMHENHVAHRYLFFIRSHFSDSFIRQGLHSRKHHARPIKDVSQVIPPHSYRA